jgi:hypothetical protein
MPTARATSAGTLPGRARAAALLGLLLLCAVPGAAAPAPALDFLYIDSAVGESAGGHTAARLGDTVFHYQYYSDGLFLLVNDRWEGFRRRYNDLQSRSVTLTRVPVSAEAYDRVRSHLFTRFVQQEQRLEHLEQLTREAELLQRLAAGEDALALEGLGLFSTSAASDPHALALRQIVERRFGAGWLQARLDEAAAAPGAPSFDAGWSVRLSERLALREALQLLVAAGGLADDALVSSEGESAALSAQERQAGEEFRGRIEASVLELLASNRPDRGSALLLQMARYQALGRSLAAGSLATLDPFPDAALAAPAAAAAPPGPDGDGPLTDARAELAALRGLFVAEPDLRMTAYGRIEAAQGSVAELERARRLAAPARSEERQLQPRRSRAVTTGLQVSAEAAALAARAAAARRDEARRALEQTYRYNLFTRNCATEIVREVNESFGGSVQAREALGGILEPGERLSFVPFRLPAAVRAAFPAPQTRTELLPSYRLRQLERLYRQRGVLAVLRENNTLTSTLYTPSRAEDTVFLFFTDDVVAPRPLLGALNLIYATVHAAGGLLLAPVDGGTLLGQSLRGMLYSLPELAFFNIRKGSFGSIAEGPAESP